MTRGDQEDPAFSDLAATGPLPGGLSLEHPSFLFPLSLVL